MRKCFTRTAHRFISVLIASLMMLAFFPFMIHSEAVFADGVIGGVHYLPSISANAYGLAGAVRVTGSTMDSDEPSRALRVQVYIGGELCDTFYTDSNHSFNRKVGTSKTGTQNVVIRSWDVENGAERDAYIDANKTADITSLNSVEVDFSTTNCKEIYGSFPDTITATMSIGSVSGVYDQTIDLSNFASAYRFTINRSEYDYPLGKVYTDVYISNGKTSRHIYNVIDTGDHAWDEGELTEAATCTSDGAKTFTCATCGETKTETIKATGHKWDAGTVTKVATCTVNGTRTYKCSKCGSKKTESIPARGSHTWDSGKVTKAAKYYSTGVRTYTCIGCNATRTTVIPKKDVSKVKPAKVKLTSASVASRTLTVKWKRIAKNTKGYQVSLKNKSNGKVKNYTVRQSSKSVLSKKIKKLKKNKTYAVRIRAYNKIGTETIYGKWSKVLSGKVK